MVKGRFQSSVKIAKTRNFPRADIGSDELLTPFEEESQAEPHKDQIDLENLNYDPKVNKSLSDDGRYVCTTSNA